MGYELNITRAEHWSRNTGREISREEWIAIIDSDSELQRDGILWSRHLGAVWTSHPKGEPLFHYWRGNVVVNNPDRLTVDKMIRIARRLKAEVQGKNGEIYAKEGSDPITRTRQRLRKLVSRFRDIDTGELAAGDS
ncbi:MAG: glycosyltransferase family A protein [Blastocatellia bacterium]